MKKEWMYLLLLCLAAISVFYFSNENFNGYLRHESIERNLGHSLDSIDYYRITKKPPFKYRVLFGSIVKGSYNATHDDLRDAEGFFNIYKSWSLLFYVTSTLGMFLLFRTAGFESSYSFLGAIIFLLLPAMFMAYTLPVHTREDTLAYTIMFAGLIFLLKEQRLLFLIMCLLGVLTRETLLLLPLLYFFFAKDDNLVRRVAIAAVPGLVWIGLRLAIGMEKYDVWEGLKWNLANPEQVVGFLFITFNVCWIPYLIHLLYYKRDLAATVGRPVHFFYRTSLFSLAVILITTFIGGIYNEIRLLYLLAPWIIIIFVDFVRNNISLFRDVFSNRMFWVYGAAVLIFCLGLGYVLMLNWQRIIVPGKYKVPYELWIMVSIGYLCLILLFLPVSYRFFILRKSYNK